MADRVAPKKQNVNRKNVPGKTQIGNRTVTKNRSADADEKTKKKTMKEERSMISKTNDRRAKDGILTNKRDQEKKPKKDKEKEAQKQKQELDQQEYEIDFEKYESDFEEEMEVEVKTKESTQSNREKDGEDPAKESVLLRRVAENQFMASAGTNDRKDTFKEGNLSENFLIEQRELAIHSNKKEGQQLVHSELEPKNDHLTDIFMELIGNLEIRKQAPTQTCGAELCVASQTEMKETESRGIQHNSYIQHNQREDTQHLMAEKQKDRRTGKRIGTFMKATEQLVNNLLNLTEATAEDRPILQNNSNLSFTSRYSVFSFQALFTECRFCAFTAKQEQNQLAIAIAVFIPSSDLRSRKSLIIEVPLDHFGSKPQRFLCCEQEVVVCRYSYDGSTLFAGLKDGSIVAWNLHSDGRPFGQFFNDTLFSKSESVGISVILPCFDTASLLLDIKKDYGNGNKKQRKKNTEDNENEVSTAIVSMELLDEKKIGILAQLVVLRESGLIQLWTAFDNNYQYQNEKLNKFSGLEERTIELIHVTSFHCFGRKEIRECATCLLVLPVEKLNHFLIGTSSGRIKLSKTIRDDGRKEYKTTEGDPEEIVCLRACPLKQTVFAAATSGQHILLYSSAIYTPVRILAQRNSQIFSLPLLFEWFPSNQSSALFFTTMNEGDKILLWRYQAASGFFESEECDFRSEFRAKIINVAIWKDHTDTSFLALCLSNGEVQVHSLEVRGKNESNRLIRSIEEIENDCFISSCIV